MNENILLSMARKDNTTCVKCGATCEHGWDAHTILTASGVMVVCDDCDNERYYKWLEAKMIKAKLEVLSNRDSLINSIPCTKDVPLSAETIKSINSCRDFEHLYKTGFLHLGPYRLYSKDAVENEYLWIKYNSLGDCESFTAINNQGSSFDLNKLNLDLSDIGNFDCGLTRVGTLKKCAECGKDISEGYHFLGDAYCSRKCLSKHIGWHEYLHLHFKDDFNWLIEDKIRCCSCESLLKHDELLYAVVENFEADSKIVSNLERLDDALILLQEHLRYNALSENVEISGSICPYCLEYV